MLYLPSIQPIYERTIAKTGINPDEVNREILRDTGDLIIRCQDMINSIWQKLWEIGVFG